RIGTDALAGLGAGTAILSAALWAFNFLGVGTQTEVARSLGAGDASRGGRTASAALWLATGVGIGLALCLIPFSFGLAGWMGTRDGAREAAASYLWIRLLGAPAVLLMTTGFGALRGLQDVRTPLRIALGVNALNLLLDPLLIFGLGPVPSLGVAGAAAASTISQWLGAAAVFSAARGRLPLVIKPPAERFRGLLRIGFDVVLRSGALLLYLLLATRAANRIGSEAGAAHQAIRSVWMFSAFLLDAYSHAAQTLIGFFLGREQLASARRVARVACSWAVASGSVLCLVFVFGEAGFRWFLVPDPASAVFASAWTVASL
ncbi:MAG: MATE family efflux transporter, partial [Gemmatimonadetes bacterium]|nr:MATE family efflux transporter [Gemmatimonadota bacterium]